MYREHIQCIKNIYILYVENTLYIQRTYAIYREHILSMENLTTWDAILVVVRDREHILCKENTFYVVKT